MQGMSAHIRAAIIPPSAAHTFTHPLRKWQQPLPQHAWRQQAPEGRQHGAVLGEEVCGGQAKHALREGLNCRPVTPSRAFIKQQAGA